MTIPSQSERTANEWETRLSSASYRVTEPRRRILRALAQHEGTLTTEALAQELKSAGVGRATVFRTIDMLADLGVLHRVHANGCHAYTVCPPVHHHHLTCVSCGRVESLEGCGLEAQLVSVARDTGFAIDAHHVELTGRCASCQ
jgi:Fe2+ or Zn2+ uptake regulation protein